MKDRTTNMKTKTKKTKINWELLAEQAYDVGRLTARRAYDDEIIKSGGNPIFAVGYQASWADSPASAKKGYVAFAKFVAKAVKDFRG